MAADFDRGSRFSANGSRQFKFRELFLGIFIHWNVGTVRHIVSGRGLVVRRTRSATMHLPLRLVQADTDSEVWICDYFVGRLGN